MNDSFLKMFKFCIPNQKKVFKKIQDTYPEYRELTYRKFKKENIEIEVLSNYIICMNDEKDMFDKIQIRNIFKYLAKNIHGTSISDVKKTMLKLFDLRYTLINKISFLENTNQSKKLIENLNMVISELEVLKKIIIDGAKHKEKNFEKQMNFEAFIRQLLNPDNYDDNILTTLYLNASILKSLDSNNARFNELFYHEILKTNIYNDVDRKKYYRLLGNYIMSTNLLKLDKRVINALNLRKDSKEFISSLDEKIKKLEKDENGRYILDDYIVTFDSDSTSRYDDALSIEKTPRGTYILGIHIADVYSLNMDAFGRVDQMEALRQKSEASLKEFHEKNAISLFVEVNNYGFIVDKKFLMTKLEVNKNMLYDEFPKILNHSKQNTKMGDTIINLAGLYHIVKNDKLPVYPTPRQMAYDIVHKYMLLYGCIASQMADENNYPILFLGEDRNVTINKTAYDAGFNNFTTYSRMTSPIWDLEAEVNQLAFCNCVFNKLNQREKKLMKMNLLMAGNYVNNKNGLQ